MVDHLLRKYLHPYQLIDEITDYVLPYARPILSDIDDDSLDMGERVFNFISIFVLHFGIQRLNFILFVHLVISMAVVKNVILIWREDILEYGDTIKEENGDKKKKKKKNGDAFVGQRKPKKASPFNVDNIDCFENVQSVVFDVDRVDEFCIDNRKPTLDWLNIIIRTLWLNFRAFAKYKFLYEIWPKTKLSLKNTALETLEIYDFNIGDKPFRVNHIECIAHSKAEMIIDFDVAYDGNANITITYKQKSLNITIPITLQKFSISNVKVRCVLEDLKPHLPLIGGIQFSFLESPVIDWQTADAAKVVNIPGLDHLIKSTIESQIIQRFVLPNRCTVPVKFPSQLQQKLEMMGFPFAHVDLCSLVLQTPLGVVRVTAVKGQDLKPSELGYKHCKTSENLNLCKPRKFSCTELLPKKCTGDPYITVSIGKESYRSASMQGNLNPEWNFSCDFSVEYYHKTLVNIDIYDESDVMGIVSDDLLGRVTEKVQTIKDLGVVEGWYNCQIYHGRVYLRFEWIPLTVDRPKDLKADGVVSGVLNLLLGTIHSQTPIRPTCHLDILQGEVSTQHKTTLDAVSNDMDWIFNEGKDFRIQNLNDPELSLQVRVFDNFTEEFIASRSFKVNSLLEQPLCGFYKVRNPSQKKKSESVALLLRSRILYDKPIIQSYYPL